ncbi:8-amino-7-oxononanoate synthase [Herbaspirillum sp. RTI4]|uniref:8-amino-7-oxononanoate synthase n=1 Tax=Herbaspirillum sp. RTI4 TaxID=3048640 RepID=UPI002AB5D8B5|nr:8-amino-7-oxononanoate synthase [Herbaspirillum sp. RTI4]MDY7579107.1 8-amino-7-oxononanoate synthase [Herbaspirillum sp. RTI4]MEA9981314.1 8-amino-7-oxononanoate synthase [Herbaspirillum sp. RTI4]
MPDFHASLAQLKEQGLLRTRRIVSSPQNAYLDIDGQRYLAFCSNDYLGLANHPELVAAAQQGMAQFGIGAGASALVSGHSSAHEALENELAAFVQLPRALHFSSGYMANLGVIPALVGVGDAVFSDRLNHACLIDGARLSRAEIKRYPHGDVAALERLLASSTHTRKLVATDAVFSMDGDIAPLAALLALCEKYDAWLLIDDAHGFGVLGEQGRGSLSHCGLVSERIIYMGTLGKAAGVHGAFVAGQADVIEWLLQRARTYVFTTGTPPPLACALSASLRVIARDSWRRRRIQELRLQLTAGLQGLPWQLLPSETAIHALIVGDNHTAVALMEALKVRGIWVPAIRPPTVPKGTARLRITLSALHTSDHVAKLLAALHALAASDFAKESV